MARHAPRLSLLALLALPAPAVAAGCSDPEPTAPAAATEGDEADLVSYGDKAPSLSASSFDGPLTQAFLRANSPDLDDAAFDAKLAAAVAAGPQMFARSWPGAFHADLAGVSATYLMGREALCLGDAHPDNFGFLRLEGETRFAYNDLDDSGYCPALVDALRYVVVARLAYADESLAADLVEAYVDGLKDPSKRDGIDGSLEPDWSDVASKQLAKLTSGDAFVPGSKDGLAKASAADEKAVRAALASAAPLSGAKVLDVGELDRSSGGSGGMRRFWALAEKNGKRTVWELKQAATPGTELGRHQKTLARSTRLSTLKKTFWSTTTGKDYVPVSLLGSTYVLRDRLAKKSVDLTGLSTGDRKRVLLVHAGLLSARHEAAMKGVKKDDLRPWLIDSSRVVAARWKAIYAASGGK